jgi:hypothetical protein
LLDALQGSPEPGLELERQAYGVRQAERLAEDAVARNRCCRRVRAGDPDRRRFFHRWGTVAIRRGFRRTHTRIRASKDCGLGRREDALGKVVRGKSLAMGTAQRQHEQAHQAPGAGSGQHPC